MFIDQSSTTRRYIFPDGKQKLILTRAALETFARHRQPMFAPEAGGLLFAQFDLPDVYVVEATPPNPTDERSRLSFTPDRVVQRQIIQNRFKRNCHFIGEWHTHPEPIPKPSPIDLRSMSTSFLQSNHELKSFLLIIVGNKAESLNLWVSAHTGAQLCELQERAIQEATPLLTSQETPIG